MGKMNAVNLEDVQIANDKFCLLGNSLMNNSLNNGLNQSKGSVFGKDAGGKCQMKDDAVLSKNNVN